MRRPPPISLSFRHAKRRRWLLLAPVAIIALSLVWSVPSRVSSKAEPGLPAADNNATGRRAPNYDIRNDFSEGAEQTRQRGRQKLRANQKDRLDKIAQNAQKAQERLTKQSDKMEVKLSRETGVAEIVSTLTKETLTGPSNGKREDVVRGYISKNADLYGLTPAQVAQLRKAADYTNPAGNISWVEFQQEIGGVPVFQGNVRAALTKNGELVRTTGRLVPGLEYDQLALVKDSYLNNVKIREKFENAAHAVRPQSSALTAADAVAAAARSIGVEVNASDLVVKEVSADGTSYVFERGPFDEDIKVELQYFAVEPGVGTLSWSMVLWQNIPAFYTLVDAEGGDLLWRKNITEEQTQSATYSIYNGDSPAPMSPSTTLPGMNGQAPFIPRTSLTLISELPAFDNLGWITDGGTTTTGNNVDAGLDLAAPNGIDAGTRPVSATRDFTFAYDPAVDAPTGAVYRNGAVTNLFFWSNRYHDRLYELGFTETARNFQQNNFGRGGLGNDFVRAEGQDSSGVNNANFSTGPDGSPPRMQMYIWPGPNPDRDGDLDQDIMLHELTHGTSNRLHANASGLAATVSRGMGEGWSDFYARSILSSADEDVNGIFTISGYATHLAAVGYTDNYYYGIRRFPYAVKTNVGANGKPHNPLTLNDTNVNKIDLTDGAFPRGIFGAGGRAGAVSVHNMGEVWCMALMEVRARLITRLGYAIGNQRMMQLVTDAMKLDPVNPTHLDGRNSLIAADIAGFGSEDVLDIWAGFATRGMGFGATMSVLSTDGKESFDYPVPGMGTTSFSDDACNANGVADPGEDLVLTIPLTNPLGEAITGVSASVVGGGSANYGTINPGQTVVQNISYQVPANTVCGNKVTVTVNVTSNHGVQAKTFTISTGQPVLTNVQNFDGVVAPALPAGWTTSFAPAGVPFTTTALASDTPPNSVGITLAATTGTSQLLSPSIAIPAVGRNQLTFRHSYNTEFEWDGAIVAISINGGGFFDILDAGGSFETGGYPFALTTAADGNTNTTLRGRAAWTGNSGGFITSTINLPAAAVGQSIRLLFIGGSDSAFTPVGAHWRIDSISLINSYQCASVATTTTVDPASGQYSDQTTLSATVASACAHPVGSVEFKVDGNSVGTVPVTGPGTVTLPYTITQAPGAHTITAFFTSSNPYYQNSNGSNTLTVTKEDANVNPSASNPFAVKVNSPGGTAGPITICADITEVADGSLGNISNATASFSFTPVAGSSTPVPGPVQYSGGGVGGTLVACTTINNVAVDVYDVTITVNNYYQGTGSTVLVVYDPSLGFVTGGGTVYNNGVLGHFGFNVKYLKNGNPQGSFIYIEHRPTGDVKLKANNMQSLAIVNNTAVLIAKGILNGVGNHTLRATVVDNGESGATDQFGLQVTGPGNVPVPSLTFPVTTIAGGNIQVPQQGKK